MAWTTPKTDWDSADYYNYGDLNRVEHNIQELATLLGTYGDTPPVVSIDESRTNVSVVFYDDLNRIEGNIELLKDHSDTPIIWTTPITDWVTLDIFDYVDANRLENNLLNLYNMINNIIAELEYCGSFTCNQDFNLGGY